MLQITLFPSPRVLHTFEPDLVLVDQAHNLRRLYTWKHSLNFGQRLNV